MTTASKKRTPNEEVERILKRLSKLAGRLRWGTSSSKQQQVEQFAAVEQTVKGFSGLGCDVPDELLALHQDLEAKVREVQDFKLARMALYKGLLEQVERLRPKRKKRKKRRKAVT